MRHGLLGSIAALAASAGLAFAQTPARSTVTSASPPGRAVAQPLAGSMEPVPMGPSTAATPPVDSAFLSAMQPQFPVGDNDPHLDTERVTFQADYLLWFIRSMASSYPLVTTSTTGPRGAAGPNTTNVFGAQQLDFNPISGARLTLDAWLPKHPRLGVEVVGTLLEARVDRFIAGYNTQMVARPVVDANTGVPASLTIAAPNYAFGGVQVAATSQLWEFEYNGKLRLWCDATKEISVLYGFRYIDLAERLDIVQQSRFVPGVGAFFYGIPFASPSEIDVADTFQTRNQYYLSQIGIVGKCRYNRWSVQWASKFGFGPVHETVVINGNSTLFTTAISPPNQVPGGLLALSSNIGRYHTDPWVVMPEGSFQVGYRLFRCTDFVVGYQFTYLTGVIRPGDQVDAGVSPNLIPTSQFYGFPGGVPRPAVPMKQTDFWVQGLNFGVVVHY